MLFLMNRIPAAAAPSVGFAVISIAMASLSPTPLEAQEGACRPAELIRAGNSGRSQRITFSNVLFPDGTRTVFAAASPLINGNNLYAPDLLRLGNSWYCYHGGWLAAGQVNDRIYLSRRDGLDPIGEWTPSQAVISEGEYVHVNDPSVVEAD